METEFFSSTAAQGRSQKKKFHTLRPKQEKFQQRAAWRSRLFGGFVWWMLQYAAATGGCLGPMDGWDGMGLLA